MTRVAPASRTPALVVLPAAETFQRLLEDIKLPPPTAPIDPPPIDAVVAQLREQTVLPTTDLLNEAIRRYIEEHSNEKALALMETMSATCTLPTRTTFPVGNPCVDGVLPNGVTRELMASLQLRTGNIDEAIAVLTGLSTVSPCTPLPTHETVYLS